ncbi:Cation:proton antiporter [Candidatus Desulfarcum epimagneticum]|uniref:Cation:proton antiporter n=1 Tax=uncultured Desulfobacteraceae bacterium TaxID=218296 RepID=A0A484HJJ9_9BACT|nr:Cation:proton antiporter [uncultured Desulfobacteraceae bacterium]
MEILTCKPLFAVAVSLAGALFIALAGKRPNLRESIIFAIAFVKLGIVLSMIPDALAGKILVFHVVDLLPGVGLTFRVDPFGLLFALVASSLWIVTTVYSIGYMRSLDEHSQTRFYAFFALALSSAIGVAFSGNLLTLYMFYELLSLSTYPLVTHHQNPESKSSGRKYLTYLMGGSIAFFLPAMILTYTLTGTLDFSPDGILSGALSAPLAILMFLLFVFGIGKAGIMPVHSWLPSAMVAPTPVSSLLHAVAVVKVGVFSLLRVCLYVFGPDVMREFFLDTILLWLASVTIIVASVFALKQDNLKARLAYSTVGQLSYIVLAGGLLTASGVAGGMVHIVMHAFGKITLFFCAGAILVNTGIKNISEMKGIGKKMPVTMTAFFFGSLSVIGLPPFGGFLSKWNLAMGCVESGNFPVLVVLLTSSMLNAAYFLPIVYQAFFEKSPAFADAKISEAPFLTLAPPVLTACVSFLLFISPGFFLSLARMAARALTGG